MIKRPEPQRKPHRKYLGRDIVQLIPLTNEKKILLIELIFPNKTSFRILELLFHKEQDVNDQALILAKKAGVKTQGFRLIKKGQPFNTGEYPLDIAIYVFLGENAKIIQEPQLDILIDYKIKKITFNNFMNLLEDGRIENSNFVNFRSQKIKNLLR